MDIPPNFPLASHIDQTILRPSATIGEVRSVAERAAELGFAALCVAPCMVAEVVQVLRGTGVAVDTVVGFPLGFQTVKTKVSEALEMVSLGAGEIDFVANRGWIKDRSDRQTEMEIRAVAEAVAPVPVKVILETSDLTREEVLRTAMAAAEAGAAYVKTSTGFFGAGADLDTVMALRAALKGKAACIKASGGIRDLASAWGFIQAGADRLGTSAGEAIIYEYKRLAGR